MKIISNYKDYYDHQVAKFGIDPLVAYERVCQLKDFKSGWTKAGLYSPSFLKPDSHRRFAFQLIAFCGTLYAFTYWKGKVYFISDYKDVLTDLSKNSISWTDEIDFNHRAPHLHMTTTTLNAEHNCPVLLVDSNYYGTLYAIVKNPRLTDFSFGKVVEPADAWTRINDFLSAQPQAVNTQTDKEKIAAHGFDLKHSFRNTK